MDYISATVDLLSRYTTQEEVALSLKEYQNNYDLAGKKIVFCGFSPYTKALISSLLSASFSSETMLIIDTEEEPGYYQNIPLKGTDALNTCDPDNSIFIICTNPYMGHYANILLKLNFNKIITYHLLCVCNKNYDFDLTRYNAKMINDRIQHFIKNKIFYIDFLNNLGDEESKIILGKFIHYVFTLNVRHCVVNTISPPYFDKLVPMSAYKIFVDLGGFDGDTLRDFMSLNYPFDEYWYFEPDEDLFHKAQQSTADTRVKFNNMAMGNKSGYTYFEKTPNMTTTGIVSNVGNTKVKIETIDNYFTPHTMHKITCIKMDVEGGEYDVLLGAENTIRQQHPVLMISIEHKIDDMMNLFSVVHKFYDKYQFYIRCCTNSLFTDLTMYALPMELTKTY